MAGESIAYTYLGKLKHPTGQYHLVMATVTIEAGDAYAPTTTKLPLTFAMLDRVTDILALNSGLGGNTANLLALSHAITAVRAADGAAFTDETTAANQATADDMTLLPAVPVVDDAYYFGCQYPFEVLELNVSTPGVGVWTLTWEYYDGSDWVEITGLVDGSSGFCPAALGRYFVRFTAPADWATVAVDGTTVYWIRARVSAYTSIDTQPLGAQAWVRDTRNVVRVAVTESGGASAVPTEKPAEAYGQAFTFYALVAGL